MLEVSARNNAANAQPQALDPTSPLPINGLRCVCCAAAAVLVCMPSHPSLLLACTALDGKIRKQAYHAAPFSAPLLRPALAHTSTKRTLSFCSSAPCQCATSIEPLVSIPPFAQQPQHKQAPPTTHTSHHDAPDNGGHLRPRGHALGVSRYVHTQPPSLLSILLLRTPTPGLTHVHHTHPPHTLTARTRRPPSSTPRSSARRGRPSPSRLRATPRTCTRSTSSSPS